MRPTYRFAGIILVTAAAIPAMADETPAAATQPSAVDGTGKISLISEAPPLLAAIQRYPKYYGDPNLDRSTVDGSLLERQYLTGSWGGLRDDLVEDGLFLDFGVTQVMQATAAGDSDNDVSYVGSADGWLGLDSGRMGLWSGGLIFAHVEGNWGDPVRGSGALLPVNFDATMPLEPSEFALTELYLIQALSEKVQVIVGKVDFAAFADTTFFANNERTQFLNTGLVNNPMLGAFVPYTGQGGMVNVQLTKEVGVAGLVCQNIASPTTSGFDNWTLEEMTYGGALVYNPTIAGLPGSYQLLAGYTTNDSVDFAVDPRYALDEIAGIVPVATKTDNYTVTFTASQYVSVDKDLERHDGKPVGWGPFFRFGIGPDDRNVIDQFYSAGVGGNGGPFGRTNDAWGIGWTGTHISSDLRGLADAAAIDVSDFEYAVEAFYNIEVTPAAHLSLDVQYVMPVLGGTDDLVLLGTRLQLDF